MSTRAKGPLSPTAAVDRLTAIYQAASSELATALDAFLANRQVPSQRTRQQFRYPLLRVRYSGHVGPPPAGRRAYAKLQRAGIYETTVTHPRVFRSYLLEQLEPLVADYGATLEVAVSDQEIPYPYVLERAEEIANAGVTPAELAHHFPTPHLSVVGDEIADGTYDLVEDEPRPLALFDAARVDFSLRRLVHYTGSDWRHVQRWILLTNYHRYVDQFVRWGLAELERGGGEQKLVLPGNITIAAGTDAEEAARLIASSAWHRYQMPAYHLTAPDGGGVSPCSRSGGSAPPSRVPRSRSSPSSPGPPRRRSPRG